MGTVPGGTVCSLILPYRWRGRGEFSRSRGRFMFILLLCPATSDNPHRAAAALDYGIPIQLGFGSGTVCSLCVHNCCRPGGDREGVEQEQG